MERDTHAHTKKKTTSKLTTSQSTQALFCTVKCKHTEGSGTPKKLESKEKQYVNVYVLCMAAVDDLIGLHYGVASKCMDELVNKVPLCHDNTTTEGTGHMFVSG